MLDLKKQKKEYLGLLAAVDREGMLEFINWIESTDFFEAPASTRYHGSYHGGLTEHSLGVFKYLSLYNEKILNKEFSEESVILVSLCHDLCKCNYYKETTRNKKNDDTGKWEKVPWYDVEEAFPAGHGEKSIFLMMKYIKLDWQELLAIRWHMGAYGMSDFATLSAMGEAMYKTNFVQALQFADVHETYLPERKVVN